MMVLLNSLSEVKSFKVGLSRLSDRSSYYENWKIVENNVEGAFNWRQTVFIDGKIWLRRSSFSEIFADWGVC